MNNRIDTPRLHTLYWAMTYRRRVLEAGLRGYLKLFPAVGITGPRQSGKSTLLRTALPEYPYVSFDDPEEAHAAERLRILKETLGEDSLDFSWRYRS